MTPVRVATGGALASIGALHLAWAGGSTWPFDDAAELAAHVAGTDAVPGTAPTVAVAGALLTAAALVADVVPMPRRLRRVGVGGVAAVLAVRGMAGVTGTTSRLVGWRTSPTFDRADRTRYGPLCLALSLGAFASLRG